MVHLQEKYRNILIIYCVLLLFRWAKSWILRRIQIEGVSIYDFRYLVLLWFKDKFQCYLNQTLENSIQQSAFENHFGKMSANIDTISPYIANAL